MRSKLIYIFSSVLILILAFVFKSNAYAACVGGNTTEVYFCSTNGTGTTWGISADYLFADPNRSFTPKTVWVSTNGSGYQCPSGTDQYGDLYIPSSTASYRPASGDKLKWYSACVDPTVNFVPTTNNFCKFGEGMFYTMSLDISCKNQKNEKYAGCYNMASFTNLGPVAPTEQCPYSKTRSSYCTKAGCTAYPSLCKASYCGGSGSCTYYRKTCSGPSLSDCNNKTGATGCSYSDTKYSNSCGGNNISGTNMCSSYSKTCAPPGPTVTLSAICNGVNPNIRVNYAAKSGTLGNRSYDLRWKESGGSWNNVCSPPTSGTGYDYVITTSALDDATTYQVQVREHTDSGYNGPTNFGSDTVTTPTCNPTYPITGTVFVDDGSGGGVAEDGIRNGSEPVFTGGATLKITNTSTGSTGTTASNGSGTYTFARKNGPYSISASATGYKVTSANPKTFSVSGAAVSNINFGVVSTVIANSWFQSIGGDIRKDDSLSVDLPTGQYFSGSQASPTLDGGVIFTSQPSATFGSGTPNQNNWLAKSVMFSPVPPGIKTSYAFINANVQKLKSCTYDVYSTSGNTNCSGSLPAPVCSGTDPSCTLNATINPGIYTRTGELNITNAAAHTFSNGTYVFLIDGNLTIDQDIIVNTNAVVFFIVKGEIVIGSDVTRLDGVYSADTDFTFEANDSGNDLPLVVQGSIIGNAALQTPNPFINLRDLGPTANATTPSIKFIFRPDFVLHAPDLIKKTTFNVSEIAPAGGH